MSKSKVRLAQYGCGYWGPNLLRAFSASDHCAVKVVAESDPARRAFVEQAFPRTRTLDSIQPILEDPEIDAVVIATPAELHFSQAREALEAGKHVLVEKPMAMRAADVDVLARLAEDRRLTLMVGHTFLFNAAVRYVRELIEQGALGEIRYIYSQRLNLGRIRSDIDALWNLAPHDISIIQYWLGEPTPSAVTRMGMDYMQPGVDDVVFLNIAYPGKVLANVHVSWLDPQKVRRMVVVGSRKMVVYDDIANDKIAVYDKGIDRKAILGMDMDFDAPLPAQFNYRSGDVLLPKIDFVEPLRVEAEHFLDCILNGTPPLTGAGHARDVVSILEQAART